jgi:hypothetical protein
MSQLIYEKIIQHTSKDGQEEVQKAIQKHQELRGSREYLSDILTFGQSFNPFIALNNIHLHKIQYNFDPKKLQEKEEKKRTSTYSYCKNNSR